MPSHSVSTAVLAPWRQVSSALSVFGAELSRLLTPSRRPATLSPWARIGCRGMSVPDDGCVVVIGLESPRSLLRWAPDAALPQHLAALTANTATGVNVDSPVCLFMTVTVNAMK